MSEVLYYAIPFFVLLLIAEARPSATSHDDHDLVGYELRDSRTSLTMGLGNVIINVGWKAVVVVVYAALYELTPLRLDPGDWWVWVLLFFADDFSYYWFHRISHESRVFWASHVVHHSSQHYNLSTALRQTWVPMTYFPFWLWMPLVGFPVWMVLLAQALEPHLPVLDPHGARRASCRGRSSSCSTRRATTASTTAPTTSTWTRTTAGILIIWDRLFGTFTDEGERVRYGLTKNIDTFNPVQRRLPRVPGDVGRLPRAPAAAATAGVLCSRARAGGRTSRAI